MLEMTAIQMHSLPCTHEISGEATMTLIPVVDDHILTASRHGLHSEESLFSNYDKILLCLVEVVSCFLFPVEKTPFPKYL